MSEEISALFVHTDNEPVNSVARLLHQPRLVTRHASTCGEAMIALTGDCPPHLVFTDVTLEDGCWEHILALTREALLPANVIVISRIADINLYRHAIEAGAWDFIAPPFEQRGINQVVQLAMDDAILRRRTSGASACIQAASAHYLPS